jgi:hypothetical protein
MPRANRCIGFLLTNLDASTFHCRLWDELERCLCVWLTEGLEQEGQVSEEDVWVLLDVDFAEVAVVFVHLDLALMVKMTLVHLDQVLDRRSLAEGKDDVLQDGYVFLVVVGGWVCVKKRQGRPRPPIRLAAS